MRHYKDKLVMNYTDPRVRGIKRKKVLTFMKTIRFQTFL